MTLRPLIPYIALIAATACHAQSTPVTDDTVVLRSGDFTLTKADYERLVIGFDRHSGAPITGASPRSSKSGDASR